MACLRGPVPASFALGLLLASGPGCTPEGDDTVREGPTGGSGTGGDDGGDDDDIVVDGCHATPRSAAEHELWVAFPYDDNAGGSDLWRAFSYDGSALEETGSSELGRAWSGRGAWTPDGAFAFLVDDDGVVHGPAGAWTEVYVASVTVDRAGETAWLVNPNWAESGGGIYRAPIDCETGALGAAELVWTGKNASVVVLRPGTASEAAVMTRELDGVAGVVHFVDLETGEVLAHHDAFGDDEAIVSDAAWDHEGERLLVADYSEFSGVPTRVAVVTDAGPAQVLDVPDPVAIVTAPWDGSSAVVLSGYDNAVFELERTASGYTLGAEVASPALPGTAVGIERGAQKGRVLLTENTGLWELELLEGGGVEDLGRLSGGGSDYSDIPGAMALQP